MNTRISRFHRLVAGVIVLLVLGGLRAGLVAPGASGQSSATRRPVPCAAIETLRALRSEMATVTNPRTGDILKYVVAGDAARSDEIIVMFNGTGGILSDWPVQMITNSDQSPRIARTLAYTSAEDGSRSLCHDYRLVLFDYPGVGDGRGSRPSTLDNLASDVDAMLEVIATDYGIRTDHVNLVGWSLGTLAALKYAFLSPAARPARTIRDLVLIATKPGGMVDGAASGGNQAQCVTVLFDRLRQPNLDQRLKLSLEMDLFRLLFPYQGQQPYDGPDSGCMARINQATNAIELNVTPSGCSAGSACARGLAGYVLNRATSPWSRTAGVPQDVYVQQRAIVPDWDHCSCAAAGPNFTSGGCSCTQAPQMSATNGGICRTALGASGPNAPTCLSCVPLQIRDRLTVINGPEDLYIQWTYGKALVEGYQRMYGVNKAVLATYRGADGAGHGVLVQHPKWVQEQIYVALQGN